jgi:hypothetical protein
MIIGIISTALLTSAMIEQLRRPKETRTWYGNILGIPYDFRRPTLEKLRKTFWNEKTSQILVPQAFGMGWSINFYPLLHPQARPA